MESVLTLNSNPIGAIIFREDAPARFFFIVLQGSVEAWVSQRSAAAIKQSSESRRCGGIWSAVQYSLGGYLVLIKECFGDLPSVNKDLGKLYEVAKEVRERMSESMTTGHKLMMIAKPFVSDLTEIQSNQELVQQGPRSTSEPEPVLKILALIPDSLCEANIS